VKEERESSRGGPAGEWSGRKAQRTVQRYIQEMKRRGQAPYIGKKSKKNSLAKWTKQKWGYVNPNDKHKKRSARGRYFPESVIKLLSTKERYATNRRKREATRRGKSKSTYTKKEARLVKNS
tara:strand:- start:169 stop:534 length:366 start_codon:yes stop_codon:yes gene_type:complete